jgi:methionyl-tRNA formyltransferase
VRVAFFGTPDYAVPTLDALVEAGHTVVTVVAQPDKRRGRGKKLQSPPVVQRARELGLETRQPKGVRSGPFPENYGKLELDVAVVVAYGRILTSTLLSVPRLGCVNGHGSLLPAWRGAAPIQHCMLAGERVTGVTTMLMDEGLDTGHMLLKRELAIGDDETAPELSARLSTLTAELIIETLSGTVDPKPQDHSAATHARMLVKEDGRMSWVRGAWELHCQVRALQPWPGTFCSFRDQPFKVKQTRMVDASGQPGEVIEAGKRLVVAAGEGALEIVSGQLPNRKAVGGGDLVNGARIRLGELFS